MYRITIPHFYELLYEQDGRTLRVELDFRDPVPCVSRRAITSWEPPFQDQALTPAEREEVIRNIVAFLKAERGYGQVDVED